jgi:hypothetical protein
VNPRQREPSHSKLNGSASQDVPWSRLLHRWVQLGMDLAVLSIAFSLAYLLRFDFILSGDLVRQMVIQLPLVLLVQFCSLFIAGCYSPWCGATSA